MDIKLDLARLKQLSDDLTAIRNEFKNADDFSDSVSTATGNDDLAGTVHNFAHAWNEKRPEMTDAVEKLQKKYQIVTDNFTKLDHDLAASLEKARADEAKTPQGRGKAK